MHREPQALLLKEAINDVRAMAQRWIDLGLELPVVFVVDWTDKNGKAFAETFISPKEHQRAKDDRDGGMQPGYVPTVLHPMSVEQADKALAKMATGKMIREIVVPDKIVTIVVAFGEVKPYLVSLKDQPSNKDGES
ncbi:MAG TPA: hypothetical protein VHD36_12425 [Pirellulales bacterium]|nr:hypothetical protein [Pirellulales bacterium]